jgi:hypothetical protein
VHVVDDEGPLFNDRRARNKWQAISDALHWQRQN